MATGTIIMEKDRKNLSDTKTSSAAKTGAAKTEQARTQAVPDKAAMAAAEVNALVVKAQKALEIMSRMDQAQTDAIVEAMALAGLGRHMELAKMAVEETGRGVYEDKITKNIFATEYIYNSIKKVKSAGVIEDNDLDDYEVIAEPIGVVAGVTPVTNPPPPPCSSASFP
jgi:acyl-CoA reductase-like NAD-dependent aldehyde dehydrogenase